MSARDPRRSVGTQSPKRPQKGAQQTDKSASSSSSSSLFLLATEGSNLQGLCSNQTVKTIVESKIILALPKEKKSLFN